MPLCWEGEGKMNVGKCIIQPLYFRERNEREQKEYDEQMKNISAL